MNKKIFISAVATLTIGISVGLAQDIHFSQWYNAPLSLNPSLAGATKDIQVIANYRDQWQSVATPYKTFNFSTDVRYVKKKWKKGFVGFGINVFSDRAGDAQLGTTQGNFAVAYHVYTGAKSTLGGGLQAGFCQKSINYSALKWGNQYDANATATGGFNKDLPTGENLSNTKLSYPDFSGGVNWQYGVDQKTISSNDAVKANVGVAMFHFGTPDQSFSKVKADPLWMKTVAHIILEIGIKNTNVVLIPNIIYSRQGPSQEPIPGLIAKYILKENSKYTGNVKGAAVSAGIQYRNQDAAIAVFMLEVSNYMMGVSYDINTSSLKDASKGKGGLEICLKYVSPSPFLYSNTKARF